MERKITAYTGIRTRSFSISAPVPIIPPVSRHWSSENNILGEAWTVPNLQPANSVLLAWDVRIQWNFHIIKNWLPVLDPWFYWKAPSALPPPRPTFLPKEINKQINKIKNKKRIDEALIVPNLKLANSSLLPWDVSCFWNTRPVKFAYQSSLQNLSPWFRWKPSPHPSPPPPLPPPPVTWWRRVVYIIYQCLLLMVVFRDETGCWEISCLLLIGRWMLVDLKIQKKKKSCLLKPIILQADFFRNDSSH